MERALSIGARDGGRLQRAGSGTARHGLDLGQGEQGRRRFGPRSGQDESQESGLGQTRVSGDGLAEPPLPSPALAGRMASVLEQHIISKDHDD
jgi:hypothetical protein